MCLLYNTTHYSYLYKHLHSYLLCHKCTYKRMRKYTLNTHDTYPLPSKTKKTTTTANNKKQYNKINKLIKQKTHTNKTNKQKQHQQTKPTNKQQHTHISRKTSRSSRKHNECSSLGRSEPSGFPLPIFKLYQYG